MNLEQIRLKQNPVLTSLLLGLGQGVFIAEKLFPRLPQALHAITLAKIGNERLQRYNLKRAPGSATKRIDISYEGVTYTVNQYSVEVPLPREIIREADESRKLQVSNHLDVSRIAMATANDVLALDYELEVAGLAIDPATYAGNVLALTGGTKWSAATGTPVDDIRAASELIRQGTGKRPNRLILSADAFFALTVNEQIRSYLSVNQIGPATPAQLLQAIGLPGLTLEVGDATWRDAHGVGSDVWGNNAILAYVPSIGGGGADISLAEPGFGFTNVLEGHPFAETPYYEPASKSWIYGATYERRPNVAYPEAGFLFQNPK